MKFAGLVKSSFIDFPKRISAVVFTQGCNMKCPYCHNPGLNEMKEGEISEEEILKFLDDRRKYLSGIVVTGGEPTLHEGLPHFLRKVKGKDYAVKLDTNGTRPQALKRLIKSGLVDYVAMDVKTSLEDYGKMGANSDKIKESISFIKECGVKHEFRTTMVPRVVDEETMKKIGGLVKGCDSFCLQQFLPGQTLDPSFSEVEPFTNEELEEMKEIIKKYCGEVSVRGF